VELEERLVNDSTMSKSSRSNVEPEVLFDEFYQQHKALETKLNSRPSEEVLENPIYYDELNELSHQQAKQIHQMILASTGEQQKQFIKILHAHPLHSEMIMQSVFISSALAKPYGYAGDKDLMLMICDHSDQGETNYAILKNRVYLNLPAAEAVRRRVKSLYRRLQTVPADSRVLNLACGPALEVAQLYDDVSNPELNFDLVDHDIDTVIYVKKHMDNDYVRVLLGNALQIIKGQYQTAIPREWLPHRFATANDFKTYRKFLVPFKYRRANLPTNHYDLIYSMGLYDYIRSYPDSPQKGASGLTSKLFDLLKPGGQLIIGNYLAESDSNPHQGYHRTMMKAYTEWELLYRTPSEILDFASGISPFKYSAVLLDENLEEYTTDRRGIIAFLALTKKQSTTRTVVGKNIGKIPTANEELQEANGL